MIYMGDSFLVGLAGAVAVVIGTLLAIFLLYLLVRISGKAWYRSKREEDITALKMKNHFTDKNGGNAYGNR